MKDLIEQVEIEQEDSGGEPPVFSGNGVSAWVNSNEENIWITVRIPGHHPVNIFPNTEASRRSLKYLAEEGE